MMISVATPVFNGMPWLPCCAASIRDQVFPDSRNNGFSGTISVEHLVQDGGSTDGSVEFLQGCPGLDWKSENDEGMYDAINRCWKRSSGDILCYLNADEQYLPGTLQTVADIFSRQPHTDILFGDAILLDNQGIPFSYRRVVAPSPLHTRLVHLGTMSCAMFFRRRLFEQGMFFDTRWRAIGDAEWVYRALKQGAAIGIVNKPLAAFAFTEKNLGSAKHALSEAREWRVQMGTLSNRLRPVLKLQHWLRKLLAGAYRKRILSTSLYSPCSPNCPVTYARVSLSHRWKRGNERPA